MTSIDGVCLDATISELSSSLLTLPIAPNPKVGECLAGPSLSSTIPPPKRELPPAQRARMRGLGK